MVERSARKPQSLGAADVPGHLPLVTLLEVKDPAPGSADEAKAMLAELDETVRSAWLADDILTPAEVQGNADTLADAVADGWPVLRETRGRAIYVLHAGNAWRSALTDADRSVGDTALFAEAGGDLSCTACAIHTINDPTSDRMGPAIEAGMLVRTRADTDSEQARANDPTRRDAAFASGAHMVSTDWPRPHPDTGYVVRFDTVARCNPVTASPRCTDEALE